MSNDAAKTMYNNKSAKVHRETVMAEYLNGSQTNMSPGMASKTGVEWMKASHKKQKDQFA